MKTKADGTKYITRWARARAKYPHLPPTRRQWRMLRRLTGQVKGLEGFDLSKPVQ